MNSRGMIMAAAGLVLGVLGGCNREPAGKGPQFGEKPAPTSKVYTLAVHPLHNPAKLIQAYQPLIDYLNEHLHGARLALEASRDYADFEKKYHARKPEFLLPNPWQTLQAMKIGYRVIAMAGEPQDFKGIFVVRKDSGLIAPSDLKGKSVSYPSPTALAACVMPGEAGTSYVRPARSSPVRRSRMNPTALHHMHSAAIPAGLKSCHHMSVVLIFFTTKLLSEPTMTHWQ